MLLNKGMLWVFGIDTIESMIKDIDQYLEEIKKDPEPPKNVHELNLLRTGLDNVRMEKVAG